MIERRAHPRFTVGEVGILRPLEWESLLGPRKALVLNVSDGGLGVEIDQSIPVGIEVRVFMEAGSYLGKVAYCKPNGNKFVVGISAHSSTVKVPRRKKNEAEPPQSPPQAEVA
jgi:hypothetical protein